MSSPPSMSTPVQQLPTPSNPPSSTPDEDPSIRSVLEEMELEVAAATKAHQPHPQPHPHPPAPVMRPVSMPPAFLGAFDATQAGATPGWWDPVSAKRAAIAAIVALVLFYPSTLQPLYDRLPAMQRFASYDLALRAALLAVVLYVLLTRLEL